MSGNVQLLKAALEIKSQYHDVIFYRRGEMLRPKLESDGSEFDFWLGLTPTGEVYLGNDWGIDYVYGTFDEIVNCFVECLEVSESE